VGWVVGGEGGGEGGEVRVRLSQDTYSRV